MRSLRDMSYLLKVCEPWVDGGRFLRLCQQLRLAKREARDDAQRARDAAGRRRRAAREAALGARFDHQQHEAEAM